MSVRSFYQSFKYAIEGFVYCVRTQRNMRIHLTAAVFVLLCSFFLRLKAFELMVLILTISLVFICEMFNTAIEKAVDVATGEFHPFAKAAKDVAAGAVLVSAVNSVIMGYLLFANKLLPLLAKYIRP